ncbi:MULTISPECIES: aminopeptidase P N-terminal domain-containing protein [unclassified Fusibacter]|uniref:aminopeptidase P N-terminal domain-containing protein n=1 Tax=unclassified Fusibacter TaxID=2624464 RepID=UPI0010134C32|nr:MULTISPECIES: aminopeptidase P N-terminal domain-containing protein [unclassified Fusibacter]MCK8059919.1 aminopeptidase P N-terminal domain-containing protein [Fusibacter sp. A2]NPE22061.1 M24 family metallopeptidase [Fusibacter sp. A1]RXV60841.1 M24 family metallopeptidase [Fusibacter sp. A1]
MHTFFTQNRENLVKDLNNGDVVILFAGQAPKSTADAHYVFKANKNFYYLTGLTQENFILAVQKVDDQAKSTLFIEKSDYDIEKWMGRKLKKEKAAEISGIDKVDYIEGFERFLTGGIYNDAIKTVYLDLEKLSWKESHSTAHHFAQDFSSRFVHIPVKSAHPIFNRLRRIKRDYEIVKIEKAVELTKVGLEAVMNELKPGMMEYQLESVFSHTIRYNGADGNSFPTIAASGEDAVILHYVENNKACEENTLVLMDLGAQYHEYSADITRTYPVSGKFTERQKTIYNIVLKAMNAVIESMKPGIAFNDLNKTCSDVLVKELTDIGLIEKPEELSKYYYHGVSHHLGLDVHDLGGRDIVLEPGMVFTVEPGLYIAEEGIGIRIEDDILITEDGHRNLSKDIIKTVEEIEAFMAQK